jgi:hypothetical protein
MTAAAAPCATPVGWDRLVEYWADDLDAAETERVEDHLFECAACTAEAARIAAVVQAFRGAIPPVVGRDQMLALRARGLAVEENPIAPGTRHEVHFPEHADILIHRLQGLDLANAERVYVGVRVESTGDLLFEDHFAPFDRTRGEVLIACQRHFAHLPPDVTFDVRAYVGPDQRSAATFIVPHVFPAAFTRNP